MHSQSFSRHSQRWLFLASLVMTAHLEVIGAEYFLSPSGSNAAAGTRAAPLASLEAVAASGRQFASGDTLVLLPGHHGAPTLRAANSGEVVVRPDDGARVTLRRLTLTNARFWTIRGLEISPETQSPFERVTIVTISGGSDNLLENCLIYSAMDTSAWSAADWDTRACNGISVTGTRNTIRNNVVRNTNFAISSGGSGTYNLIQGNTVDSFSGDGLRGLGDYCVFEYNIIKNVYDVNANHDDGFQSWSTGPGGVGTGVVRGVILRGNTFIAYEDPNRPFVGTMQGIGCFDGYFEDWVIENNLIVTDHYHGITLGGARNCRIINNTVLDIVTTRAGRTWIRVSAHKDGTIGTGNIIRNNLVTALNNDSGVGTVDHNQVISTADYGRHFMNPTVFDFRLRATSAAIDAGSANLAPNLDISRASRPIDGNADGTQQWDLGAFEFIGEPPGAPSDLLGTPED